VDHPPLDGLAVGQPSPANVQRHLRFAQAPIAHKP
jgi:hypothetical protein